MLEIKIAPTAVALMTVVAILGAVPSTRTYVEGKKILEASESFSFQAYPLSQLPEPVWLSSATPLGPYLAIIGGCIDIACKKASTQIALFDPINGIVRRPVFGYNNETFPPSTPTPTEGPSGAWDTSDSSSSRSGSDAATSASHQHSSSASDLSASSTSHHTPKGSSWVSEDSSSSSSSSDEGPTRPPQGEMARLKYGVAGSYTAVTLLDSIFVLSTCQVTREHDVAAAGRILEEGLKDDKYLRVQRITLLEANQHNKDPPIVAVDGDFAKFDSRLYGGRLNASCMASGSNFIYIAGGVGRHENDQTGKKDWRFQQNVILTTVSGSVFNYNAFQLDNLPVGPSYPAAVSTSETLWFQGGWEGRDPLDLTPSQVHPFRNQGTGVRVIQGQVQTYVVDKFVEVPGYAPNPLDFKDKGISQAFMVGTFWSLFNGVRYNEMQYFHFPQTYGNNQPGWNPVTNDGSNGASTSFGVVAAYPHKGKVQYSLLGGLSANSGIPTNFAGYATFQPSDCCWEGYFTRSNTSESDPENDMRTVEWNSTIRAVLTFDADGGFVGDLHECAVGHERQKQHPEKTCKLRISLSPRCDNVYPAGREDMVIDSFNMERVTRGQQEYYLSPEIHLPETMEAGGLVLPRLYLYACFSRGTFFIPEAACINGDKDCLYSDHYYAVNHFNPLSVHALVPETTEAPTTEVPPTPSPTTTTTDAPPTPAPTPLPPAPAAPVSFFASPGGAALIAICSCLVVAVVALGVQRKCKSSAADAQAASGVPGAALGDGRYRVVEKIGKGSFSTVYLVERVPDKRRFALKYIQCPDENDRREAMKECEVIAKLKAHPHVIKLEDMFLSYKFDDLELTSAMMQDNAMGSPVGGSKGSLKALTYESTSRLLEAQEHLQRQPSGRSPDRGASAERYLSLVMEYHDKGDLGHWVRKMRQTREYIPEATVVSVAYQVCSVLQYMHSQQPGPIIHRDLKPENLLLASVQYTNLASTFLPLVVSDFGLSRVMDKAFCETGVGSLPYVAPECWRRKYSTKVDLWAVGCILYAMCSKRVDAENVVVMFSESSRPDFRTFLYQQVTKTYQYSDSLANFILLLLEVDVQKRPSAEQCIQMIKKRPATNLDFDALTGSSRAALVMTQTNVQGTQSGSFPMNTVVQEFYLINSEDQDKIRDTKGVGVDDREMSVGGTGRNGGSLEAEDDLPPPRPGTTTSSSHGKINNTSSRGTRGGGGSYGSMDQPSSPPPARPSTSTLAPPNDSVVSQATLSAQGSVNTTDSTGSNGSAPRRAK